MLNNKPDAKTMRLRKAGLKNVVLSCREDPDLDEVAIKGKVRFIETLAWGTKPFISKIVESPTWLDVCKVAQEMIDYTGDNHHIFLEEIPVVGKTNEFKICHFGMGS